MQTDTPTFGHTLITLEYVAHWITTTMLMLGLEKHVVMTAPALWHSGHTLAQSADRDQQRLGYILLLDALSSTSSPAAAPAHALRSRLVATTQALS